MRFTARSVLASGLLMLLAASACRSRQEPTRVRAASFGSQTVYLDEIDKTVAADLFEIRSNALHRIVAERLIQAESTARGVSVQELWRLEVDAKISTPDAQETERALKELVAAGRLTAEEASQMPPDQASERVRRLRMVEHEGAFFQSLSAKARLKIDFSALGKPSLDITREGPSLGPANASLTFVEFADLTKSFTAMWQPTLEKLVTKYGSQVRFLFKQKPEGPDSASAKVAEAALCADEQKMYWEFRKALFHQGMPVAPAAVTAAATASELDLTRFEQCLSSGRMKQNVAGNLREAMANRLQGEPVLSVNGVRLSGAQPFDAVDVLLKNEMSTL